MYSEKYNTIFVHIPKAGGQSIERVFLEKHGLKWGQRGELVMGHNEDPERGPKQLAHMLAREYLDYDFVPADKFAACFKFAVVRNPYDRAVSQFRYKRPGRIQTFGDFVGFLERQPTWRHGVAQHEFVLDADGKMMIDQIIRLESLDAEFGAISQRLFGETITLPHVNTAREDRPADADDPALRQRVYKLYERDFDLFQYPSGL